MAPISLCTALSALALLPWESVAASAPKVLGYDFARVKRDLPPQKLERRDGGVAVNLVNDQVLYLVNISVGTPPQPMSVQLDTGSSDLWVPSVDSNLCREGDCRETGSFDESKSSSFQTLDVNPFHIEYGDNSVYDGDLFADTLQMAGTTVKNVTMGIVDTAQNVVTGSGPVGNGLWGISFSVGQANTVVHDDPPYKSVLQKMKDAGVIKSIAYSLWLDSIDAKSGSILFGGVDSAKYNPPLIGVPIIKNPKSQLFSRMIVEFTSLSLKDPKETVTLTNDDTVALALLDSGTTSSQVPKSLADKIYSYFGVRLEFGSPFLPCNLATADVSLTFGFGGANGPKITVPIAAFVSASTDSDPFRFADGTEACMLLLEYAQDDQLILGDSFLRSAYVVYDLDNHQIALAQSNLSPGAPNIAEIDDKIPNVASVVSSIPLPAVTTDAYDATVIPSTPTEAAIPSDFTGRFTDSAPKASFTAKAGSTSKAAAAGGTAAMIGSKGYLVCGAVSIISALLGGSLIIFM